MDPYSFCIEIVKLLLNNNANVNIKDNSGKTCLMYALTCIKCERSSLKILKLLLKNNANIDAQDNNGITALMLMSFNTGGVYDSLKMHRTGLLLRSLLENNANTNIQDIHGYTALMYIHSKGENIQYKKASTLLLEYDAIYTKSSPFETKENTIIFDTAHNITVFNKKN